MCEAIMQCRPGVRRHVPRVILVGLLAIAAATLRADDPAPTDATPTTQPAKISPQARQLLDQISRAYTSLKTLDLAGQISIDLKLENDPGVHHSAGFVSSFAAPNRFRHEVKDDVLVGSTGQKIYTFKADENAYTLADAPKERVSSHQLPSGVWSLLESQDPSLVLALSKDPAAELIEGVVDASKPEDTNVADKTCATLKLTNKDKTTTSLAIDPDSGLVRQVKMDLTSALKKQREDLSSAVVTVAYTKVTPDAQAKEEQFAWTPPSGAKDADAAAAARPLDAVSASALEGKPAPSFKLDSLEGKPVALADLKGHVIVLDFWATWCGPCRMSLPHLDKLYQAKKEKGVKFFAVDQQEEKPEVQQFVTQTKLSVPVLLDSDGKTGEAYGVEGIPQTVVIGKDGNVKRVFVGFNPEESPEALRKAVESAMAEK